MKSMAGVRLAGAPESSVLRAAAGKSSLTVQHGPASGDYRRLTCIRGSSLAFGRFALRDKRFSASIKAENSIAA